MKSTTFTIIFIALTALCTMASPTWTRVLDDEHHNKSVMTKTLVLDNSTILVAGKTNTVSCYNHTLVAYSIEGNKLWEAPQTAIYNLGPEKLPAVLLYSSLDSAELHKKCDALGVRCCITKPVKQRELFAGLAQLSEKPVEEQANGAEESKTTTQQQVAAPASGKSFTVLVAEDLQVNIMLIKALLMKSFPGVVIVEAENGIMAIEEYKNKKPDLILMDFQMPEMNGLDATKAIRELETDTGKRIPIIALTARSSKEEIDSCYEAGMDDFLSKPLDADKLKSVITRYFESVE